MGGYGWDEQVEGSMSWGKCGVGGEKGADDRQLGGTMEGVTFSFWLDYGGEGKEWVKGDYPESDLGNQVDRDTNYWDLNHCISSTLETGDVMGTWKSQVGHLSEEVDSWSSVWEEILTGDTDLRIINI